MAKEFPSSASQDRMLTLFGLTCDGTTEHAKAVLSAAGLPENGIPAGLTPQKAKKLADDELVALYPYAAPASAVAAGTARVEQDRERRSHYPRTQGDYIRLAKERNRTNDKLRAAGYRWYRANANEEDVADEYWMLLDPDGQETTVAAALAAIGA